MSERIKHTAEHSGEKLDLSNETAKNLERLKHEAERDTGERRQDTAELQQKVEQQAVSGKELTVGEKESAASNEFGVYSDMKSQAYERSLKRIQQRLSGRERALSKVMHNKTVDATSELLGKTIARPSGILGAGSAALIGSSIVLYMAKTYGFEYNFGIFVLLLAGGFALGLVIELGTKLLARLKR